MDNPRTVEEVFKDFKGRRAAVIKALTADVEEFYQQCDPGYSGLKVLKKERVRGPQRHQGWCLQQHSDDLVTNGRRIRVSRKDEEEEVACAALFIGHKYQSSRTLSQIDPSEKEIWMTDPRLKNIFLPLALLEGVNFFYLSHLEHNTFVIVCILVFAPKEKENLCLYGFPSEQWEVNLPAEEVPPELPEPALGINFARDGMQENDWLALVAVHSDAWLLSVAFYFGARFGFDKADRKRLFNMVNDLPTVFEAVTGAAKKQAKDKTSVSNHSNNKSKTNQKSVKHPSLCFSDP
ncbi:hypothetical protein RHSIM_Rhsim05G0013000 [Rhododendron simsii]|uniref:PHD finger protein ALFIN-LIKE n=1 Tax=Rhododendron simsii TaxID=118357 RepID=A0A834GV87_RHOSS|nr:hypothetical protein RHSIM_Rhsim05G0013000 [Rhododendron simsii]